LKFCIRCAFADTVTELPYEVGLVRPDPAMLIAESEAYLGRRGYIIGDLSEDLVLMTVSAKYGSGPQLPPSDDTAKAIYMVVRSGLGALVSLEDGKARLDEIFVDDISTDWAASELLSANAVAERLQLSPATLAVWRTANKVIAFCSDAGEPIYLVRQFEGSDPIEGLDRVVPFFPSLDEVWEWLVTPCRYTNDEAPIDRLRSRHVNEEVKAAEGEFDFQ
jgi:hypothetical protein